MRLPCGEKWVSAIPILVLICLSAIPRAYGEAVTILLQSVDKTRINLIWNIVFTSIFAISLFISIQGGTLWVAAAVLITHAIGMPLFALWGSRYVFSKHEFIQVE